MPTIHLLIKGKVQGVFYRASAKEMAEQLHIKGWIRNTSEGEVELMATAEREQLDQFIHWCRQGPSGAKVEDVIVSPRGTETFSGFVIRR